MTSIIVLAHEPIEPNHEAFTDGYLNHSEWVVYDGVFALEQAEARARDWRDYFQEVQIRRVGKIGDVY